jgi:RNA polymerase sigma-70 factor (ECF subfamily)
VAKGRRPTSDADIDDAEYFDNGDALRDAETPENRLFGDELAAVVRDALEGLPDDLRTALTLREFEGLSYEDIAEVMDCPVGTVRSRIFRAREAVDARVKAQINGD